jgi:4-diphosphocytidyl-2-C-methyl-D-erythritol kinase
MGTIEAFAPAKINLTLHVIGQRSDGFHLLDSLVVFADIGDKLTVSTGADSGLTVSGPMADGVPTDRRNLVLQAAELMGVTAKIHLEKHLPAAAGIGGGSSDAAAILRALSQVTGQPIPDLEAVIGLGADVPLCLTSGLVRMRGIGYRLEQLGASPKLSLILVNPGVAVPTGAVFQNLKSREFPPMQSPVSDFSRDDWIGWLSRQRNDLETSAIKVAPVISHVLQVLRHSDGCLLARMSGSGATCFAIMRDDQIRDHVAATLKLAEPDWWVQPCNSVAE